MESSFHKDLYNYIDQFVHLVYKVTRKFPKEELFGSVSQFRRAAMSIMLNYKEGFARRKRLVKINFYEISFGSCQECKYLIDFSFKEKWIEQEEFSELNKLAEFISSMFWKTIEGLEQQRT